MKAERSLKARALQLLAQRDQSRLELRRKLVRSARARDAASGADRADRSDRSDRSDGADGADREDGASAMIEVDALLDWLEAHRFLSDERFVESRVHARQARFGLARIKAELAQHAAPLPPALAESLAASELERCAAVRERRFGAPPGDAAGTAAQARFLVGRGFAPELVHRLLRRARRAAEDEAGATGRSA